MDAKELSQILRCDESTAVHLLEGSAVVVSQMAASSVCSQIVDACRLIKAHDLPIPVWMATDVVAALLDSIFAPTLRLMLTSEDAQPATPKQQMGVWVDAAHGE